MRSVLQINSGDLLGQRFNGYDLTPYLEMAGYSSSHLVFWNKHSDAAFVGQLFPYPGAISLTRKLNKLERHLSTQAKLHPHTWCLPVHKAFRAADLIHYHIIHDGYFSLGALPFLSKLQPTIWTWHDPWPMTGHCLHPMECGRWKTGCGSCPDLRRVFEMQEDRTAAEFARKGRIYGKLPRPLDVIVASEWMMNLARQSPIARNFNFHLIRFGINLEKFSPRDQSAAQHRLGVLPGQKVLFLRAMAGPYKGLDNILAALTRLELDDQICIIVAGETGHFDRFIGTHQIVELGWTTDDDLLIDAYTAADLFLMPSTAESFGLMAIEAMACGKAVISFQGTPLPETTFAPKAGVAVPMNDNRALAATLERLLANPEECTKRGGLSRSLAEAHYDIRDQATHTAALYSEVVDRFRSGVRPSDPISDELQANENIIAN